MSAIFENEDFVKGFVKEWGNRFHDTNLLLECEGCQECEDKDEKTVIVTSDEDIDVSENEKICEDALFEVDSVFSEAYRVKPGAMSGKMAVATLVAAAIYYAAQTYRTLRRQGKDPVVAKREQVQALKYAMTKCNRTKNPRACKDRFEKQIRIAQGKPTL